MFAKDLDTSCHTSFRKFKNTVMPNDTNKKNALSKIMSKYIKFPWSKSLERIGATTTYTFNFKIRRRFVTKSNVYSVWGVN